MKIAHLSDPHLLDLAGVEPSMLRRGKRMTGWLTLRMHRANAHRAHIVEAMVEDINRGAIDHVVVTGDLTNLALEPEFAYARRVLGRLRHGAREVSVIPGNHDLYTRGSERTQRFTRHFAEHITSDLPVATDHPSGPFPFVRLRGPVAIIGLSSAIARPPLVASGHAGTKQLDALAAVLDHDEVRARTPVVLIHHPLFNAPGLVPAMAFGLREARHIRALLQQRIATGLVLHGHMHDRWHRELPTRRAGTLHHVGATSASLVHRQPHRMAGYNVYEFDGRGRLLDTRARVWNVEREDFGDAAIPRRAA